MCRFRFICLIRLAVVVSLLAPTTCLVQLVRQHQGDTPPVRALYVGVMSAPANRKKRDTIRHNYLKKLRQTPGVQAEFIIGHGSFPSFAISAEGQHGMQGLWATPGTMQLEQDVEKESKTFGDIRRIALPESYENLPDKVLQFFREGVQQQYNFLVKIDDDQLLNTSATLRFIAGENPEELLYAGAWLNRDMKFEGQRGPMGGFAPYFSGMCYLLSRTLAQQITEVHASHSAEFLSYGSSSEDATMGRWVQWEKQQELLANGAKVIYKEFTDMVVHGPLFNKTHTKESSHESVH